MVCQDPQPMVGQFTQMLDEHGIEACLFALAHAVRGENDTMNGRALFQEALRTAAVREYVANQLAGLAAFWRIQVPPGQKR